MVYVEHVNFTVTVRYTANIIKYIGLGGVPGKTDNPFCDNLGKYMYTLILTIPLFGSRKLTVLFSLVS